MPTPAQHAKGPGVFKDGNPLIHKIHQAISWGHLRFATRPLPDRIAIYFHQLEQHEQQNFIDAVNWLHEAGYKFVSPAEYLEPGGKKVFLSFDDNHHFWWSSLPLFADLGVHATFYTNSGVFRESATAAELDTFFNRIGWFGERRTLTRQELQEIATAGHTIGAHTHTHPALQNIPLDQAKEEIRRSQAELEDCLGTPIKDFSFPYGMPRFMPEPLRDYCEELGLTIADATPGMLHQLPTRRQIHRTFWRLELDLPTNQARLAVDGRFFTAKTGKSALF